MMPIRAATRICTIKADVSPGKPYYPIVVELGLFKEATYKNYIEKDVKYFIAATQQSFLNKDSSVSRAYVSDEEASRLIWQ